jgi:hypothetical protein
LLNLLDLVRSRKAGLSIAPHIYCVNAGCRA